MKNIVIIIVIALISNLCAENSKHIVVKFQQTKKNNTITKKEFDEVCAQFASTIKSSNGVVLYYGNAVENKINKEGLFKAGFKESEVSKLSTLYPESKIILGQISKSGTYKAFIKIYDPEKGEINDKNAEIITINEATIDGMLEKCHDIAKKQAGISSDNSIYYYIGGAALILGGGAYYFLNKKSSSESELPAPPVLPTLP